MVFKVFSESYYSVSGLKDMTDTEYSALIMKIAANKAELLEDAKKKREQRESCQTSQRSRGNSFITVVAGSQVRLGL